MKIWKIFSGSLLSLILVLSSITTSFAGVSDEYIDEELAKTIAYGFLNARAKEDKASDLTKGNYVLQLDETMYDLNEIPSAYQFLISDKSKDKKGYIVIGAQEKYAPIIEYGFAKPAIDESYTNEKIYYLGDADYYMQEDDMLKGIRTNQEIEKNVLTQISAVTPHKEDQSIAQYWDFIYDSINTLQSVQASHGEDEKVDNPEDFEHNYDKLHMRYLQDYKYAVTKFGINYILEPDAHYRDGACGLIAATNAMVLLDYGYNESTIYGDTKKTYKNLKDIAIENFGNFSGVGLFASELKSTVEEYLAFMDYSNANVYNEIAYQEDMINKIDHDMPIICQVRDYANYGDHYVLVLGYEEYQYNALNDNATYFYMHDGDNTYYLYHNGDTHNFGKMISIEV